MTNKNCVVCGKPSSQTCSLCNIPYYCGKDHQKLDWKKGHKASCSPFKIETNPRLGRHLVATRRIQPNEVIVRRRPLLLCPKAFSFMLCLGCHKLLDLEKELYVCGRCEWPLCSVNCERSTYHVAECEVMAASSFRPRMVPNGSKQSAYSIIAPLRALLLKADEKKYRSLSDMESHVDEVRDTAMYQALKRSVVPLLKVALNADTSEEEVLRICSIFDTNAFDVRDSARGIWVRGLYPVVSYMSHDCKRNTKHTFEGDDFEIVVRATVPVAAGEVITTSYTQTLWGTTTRRQHLKKVKHFDCCCQRCSDPTEMGTYAGSVTCPQCREGPSAGSVPLMVSADPLDGAAPWKCERCQHVISGEDVQWGNDALKEEISQIDKSTPGGLENFLRKYHGVLHPTNCHVLEVKYALFQMYGGMRGLSLIELPDELLERKIKLSEELLHVADILEPGMSRFRGCLLFELHEVLVIQAKRNHAKMAISKEQANEMLTRAKLMLEESATILSNEPDKKDSFSKKMRDLSHIAEIN